MQKYISIISLICILFVAGFVFAQGQTPGIPQEGIFIHGLSSACTECGECNQCDIMQVVVNVVNFLFNLAGPLSVLVIILGGFLYIISGGNPEQAKMAKGAVTAGIVGFVIILVAFTGVDFILKVIGYEKSGSWTRPDLDCPERECVYLPTSTSETGEVEVSEETSGIPGGPAASTGWQGLIDEALKKCPNSITPRGEFDEYYNKYGEQYGINPHLIKVIASHESGENPRIENKKGGGDFGIMQFIPETAASYVPSGAPASCRKKVSGQDYSNGQGYCTNRPKNPDPACCQVKSNSCGRYAADCKEWLGINPEIQIQMGARLINDKVKAYRNEGGYDKAVAAYNGPKNFPFGSNAPYVQKIYQGLESMCK